MRNQGRRLRASAAEKAEDLQEMLSGGYEETRSRVEDGIRRTRDVIDEKRSDAREAVDAGKAAVGSDREELERRLATARKTRGRARLPNALLEKPHASHLSIPEAIDVARSVGAARTVLTHLTHRYSHLELEARLPDGIEPAYDGLTLSF